MTADKHHHNTMPLDISRDGAIPPASIDRRAFMMRSALAGAMTVITGRSPSDAEAADAKYKKTSEGGLAVSVVLC